MTEQTIQYNQVKALAKITSSDKSRPVLTGIGIDKGHARHQEREQENGFQPGLSPSHGRIHC